MGHLEKEQKPHRKQLPSTYFLNQTNEKPPCNLATRRLESLDTLATHGPGNACTTSTYTEREPRKPETGFITFDLDQGMTTTSVPPLRGKLSTWRSMRRQRNINLPVQSGTSSTFLLMWGVSRPTKEDKACCVQVEFIQQQEALGRVEQGEVLGMGEGEGELSASRPASRASGHS